MLIIKFVMLILVWFLQLLNMVTHNPILSLLVMCSFGVIWWSRGIFEVLKKLYMFCWPSAHSTLCSTCPCCSTRSSKLVEDTYLSLDWLLDLIISRSCWLYIRAGCFSNSDIISYPLFSKPIKGLCSFVTSRKIIWSNQLGFQQCECHNQILGFLVREFWWFLQRFMLGGSSLVSLDYTFVIKKLLINHSIVWAGFYSLISNWY